VGTGDFQGTLGGAINPDGRITSAYFDANDVAHGYIRNERGMITTFDVRGAGTEAPMALSLKVSIQVAQ